MSTEGRDTYGGLGAPTRDTLVTQIAERVALSIRSGRLEPGTRLVETELAADMGTSRGPIREALRQLAETGLVQNVPRRGSFVTQPGDQDRTELIVMRATLEGLAGRLAAIRRAKGELDLTPLREALDEMQAAADAGDDPRFQDVHWRFHEQLCLAAHNAWLHRNWVQMRDGIGLLMAGGQHAMYSDLVETVRSHVEIVEIIASRAPDYCEHYLREKLLRSGYRFMEQEVPDGLADDPTSEHLIQE